MVALREQHKELAAQVADKQKLLEQERRIQSLEAHRRQLQPGAACPLCGAHEHPAIAAYAALDISASETALKEKQAALDALVQKGQQAKAEQAATQATQKEWLAQQAKAAQEATRLQTEWADLLAGLVGAGRTETVRLIFGADKREAGEIRLDGRLLAVRSPRDAIAGGIGLLTEDRKLQGLVLQHSVKDNFALPSLNRLAPHGFVRRRQEREEFGRYVDQLKIRIPHQEQRAGNLSGGNQQKVVLAKWLARNCEVLIFDEPTRGIDAGAKYEIYLLMNELAAQGKAILMISSELPEVIGMADRVIVMHEGRVTGEIEQARGATQEQIMQLAVA